MRDCIALRRQYVRVDSDHVFLDNKEDVWRHTHSAEVTGACRIASFQSPQKFFQMSVNRRCTVLPTLGAFLVGSPPPSKILFASDNIAAKARDCVLAKTWRP